MNGFSRILRRRRGGKLLEYVRNMRADNGASLTRCLWIDRQRQHRFKRTKFYSTLNFRRHAVSAFRPLRNSCGNSLKDTAQRRRARHAHVVFNQAAGARRIEENPKRQVGGRLGCSNRIESKPGMRWERFVRAWVSGRNGRQ